MGNTILQIENLVKHFRSNWTFRRMEAVKDISLEVYRGESFGFLGPNGAGKTTTIKCIMGLVRKTSGRIFFDGTPLVSPAQHEQIGYLPELPYFYEHLSVAETLDLFAALHGIRGKERARRVDEALERVGLAQRKKSAVRALSKGLQQRLGFAQAILNRPAMLFLDEPFSGLDPMGRREMRELILDLKAQGTTIFLSSHILSDVEKICDRVSIMALGKLKATFYLKDIPTLFGERYELVASSTDRSDTASAQRVRDSAIHSSSRDGSDGPVLSFEFESYDSGLRAMHDLIEYGYKIREFQSMALPLEEIFVKLTSGETSAAVAPRAFDPEVRV
ncbi:MAG: ABC transporter ATP-binding protein [Bdellovibrionota bacterium]